MRDGWKPTLLGEVFEPSSARVADTHPEPPVYSVTKYAGVVLASDYFDRRVASESLALYKLMEPGDWAYSTIHIDEGSIARNNLESAGAVSPMYTTMKFVGPDQDARYFELVVRAPEMLARFRDAQQGSINRRRSLPWRVFSSLEVMVPPLPEQRRIVDLVGALDEAITAAESKAAAIDELTRSIRDALPEAPTLSMGHLLLAIESGTSTKRVAGLGRSVNVLSLAAIRPARFHRKEVKCVGAAELPQRSLLLESDLLITRSNTPDRVGYVCVARDVPKDTYLPDLVWRLVPDTNRVSKDYLEQVLSSTPVRNIIAGAASGTSLSMRKINKAGFSRVEIPVPPREVQDGYVGPLRDLGVVRAEQDSVLDRLRSMRSALLTALLSGDHAIPESYDELLGEAS